MKSEIKTKILNCIKKRDPSFKRDGELEYYPFYHAYSNYLLANECYKKGDFTCARRLSYEGSLKSGIEIHPGATIGDNFFIDHGHGVVIGETAIIGDNVMLYHGVTLGAKSFKDTGKRHPTVGNNVVIGCESIILGDITIGDNVTIAAGSVVTKDIPSDCTYIKGNIIKKETNNENCK